MNIICFSGRRKSGKSLAASYIIEADSRFSKISFAEILKDEYAKENNIPRHNLEDILEKERHRRALQLFGDKKKEGNEYYFVTALLNTLDPTGYYVLDDLRFLFELEAMFKLGAKLYGVSSDPHKRAARGWVYDRDIDNHESEAGLGDFCSHTWYCLGGGIVYNNGTKEILKDKAFEIVKKHFPYTIDDLAKLSRQGAKVA